MTDPSVDPEPPSCCLPGDVTVTEVPYGYLVGRVTSLAGIGPWWHYVSTMADRGQAMELARSLARENQARAWFHKGGADYDLIPLD